MKLHLDPPEQEVRIELIPLIDVIFCILTFFILAAVTITRQTAINVDLPQAATGTTQMRDMMIVSVDPVGQIYVDKQPVSKDQLYQALLTYQQQKPQGLMVLYASRLASYNDVVQVLDLLRSVGGDRVALATLPGDTGGGTDTQIPQSPLQLPGTIPNLNNPNNLPEGVTPGNSFPSLTNPTTPNTTNPFNSNPLSPYQFNPNPSNSNPSNLTPLNPSQPSLPGQSFPGTNAPGSKNP